MIKLWSRRCGTHEERINAQRILVNTSSDHLGDLAINRRIILKLILKGKRFRAWNAFGLGWELSNAAIKLWVS
jgi:hypothetical protein